MFSHYEKPFFVDETVDDPIATSDNHFILEVYDKKFNQINTLSVPVAAEQGALYGMRSFGLFSDDASDMCKGTFSGDDKMNFIVTNQNYTVANDDYTYTFEVYNEDSQKIAVINQAVSSWQKLSDIPGKESQYGFIITGGSSEAIEMVNIPSCNVAATFSAMVGDAQLSDNLDRYPVGDEYQYVFGIGNGLYDEQKNVISRIGWFNKDCSVDHFVSFNIGQDGENFTPLVNGTVLNPYLSTPTTCTNTCSLQNQESANGYHRYRTLGGKRKWRGAAKIQGRRHEGRHERMRCARQPLGCQLRKPG